MYELMQKLCGVLAPSGREYAMTETVREMLAPYADEVKVDVLGNVVECLMRDREDGKRRAFYAANLSAVAAPAFCLLVLSRLDKVSDIPAEEISYFDSKIFVSLALNESFEPFQTLIWMCLGCVLISLLLRRLYFIDAILALIPLGYAIVMWELERLPEFEPILVSLLVIPLVFRIAVMLGEPVSLRSTASSLSKH